MAQIKDSGHRRTFDTGAQRDRGAGKGMPALISPIFIDRLARLLEAGAAKYSARNWEKGMPLSEYLQSALRHLFQYLEGRRDEDHMAAAAFNVMAFIHTEEMVRRGLLPVELDDLPDYTRVSNFFKDVAEATADVMEGLESDGLAVVGVDIGDGGDQHVEQVVEVESDACELCGTISRPMKPLHVGVVQDGSCTSLTKMFKRVCGDCSLTLNYDIKRELESIKAGLLALGKDRQ